MTHTPRSSFGNSLQTLPYIVVPLRKKSSKERMTTYILHTTCIHQSLTHPLTNKQRPQFDFQLTSQIPMQSQVSPTAWLCLGLCWETKICLTRYRVFHTPGWLSPSLSLSLWLWLWEYGDLPFKAVDVWLTHQCSEGQYYQQWFPYY